jgi:cardiolipin synthase
MHRWLRHLPNLISSIRILLVLPIAVTLWRHQFVTTLWLFAVAAGSDAVDGYLARRFGWQTELGGMLDPVADKLMLATVFIMFAVLGEAPLWLTAAVITRDCVIVLGAVSYRVLLGPVRARPSHISKLNTLIQILFVLAVIGTQRWAWPPSWVLVCLGALVLVTTIISGIDYVLVYGRQAVREAKAPAAAPTGRSRAI